MRRPKDLFESALRTEALAIGAMACVPKAGGAPRVLMMEVRTKSTAQSCIEDAARLAKAPGGLVTEARTPLLDPPPSSTATSELAEALTACGVRELSTAHRDMLRVYVLAITEAHLDPDAKGRSRLVCEPESSVRIEKAGKGTNSAVSFAFHLAVARWVGGHAQGDESAHFRDGLAAIPTVDGSDMVEAINRAWSWERLRVHLGHVQSFLSLLKRGRRHPVLYSAESAVGRLHAIP